MNRAKVFSKLDDGSHPVGREDRVMDCYGGVELGPNTLESLVTWDVSGHAQRERDRLNAAHRIRE